VNQRSTPGVATGGAGDRHRRGSAYSIAVTEGDGQTWTWGWNVLDSAAPSARRPDAAFPVPARAVGVTGVDQVSAERLIRLHALLTPCGWGYNTEGQVGNGATTPADTGTSPGAVDGIDSVTSIDAGGIHTIALRANGEVWSWGK
jgi:alpha-tubulin suppressor-like RCC1 family protein